jgi:hypothetical protein
MIFEASLILPSMPRARPRTGIVAYRQGDVVCRNIDQKCALTPNLGKSVL